LSTILQNMTTVEEKIDKLIKSFEESENSRNKFIFLRSLQELVFRYFHPRRPRI
jgi:low affinity Fe/Cu permease